MLSLLVFMVLPLLPGDAKFTIKPLGGVASLVGLLAGHQWANGPSSEKVPGGKTRRLRLVRDVCGEANTVDAQYARWIVMEGGTDTAAASWRVFGIRPAKYGHRPLRDWILSLLPEATVRVMWVEPSSCFVANTWSKTKPGGKRPAGFSSFRDQARMVECSIWWWWLGGSRWWRWTRQRSQSQPPNPLWHAHTKRSYLAPAHPNPSVTTPLPQHPPRRQARIILSPAAVVQLYALAHWNEVVQPKLHAPIMAVGDEARAKAWTALVGGVPAVPTGDAAQEPAALAAIAARAEALAALKDLVLQLPVLPGVADAATPSNVDEALELLATVGREMASDRMRERLAHRIHSTAEALFPPEDTTAGQCRAEHEAEHEEEAEAVGVVGGGGRGAKAFRCGGWGVSLVLPPGKSRRVYQVTASDWWHFSALLATTRRRQQPVPSITAHAPVPPCSGQPYHTLPLYFHSYFTHPCPAGSMAGRGPVGGLEGARPPRPGEGEL